ncbi:hypothetical protein HMPREF3208_01347 [Gardnerella vaginalis]|uniref:Uncharacterized protein n=1 Tax=Gardnerella vaginalis TaxID=2702 RepID=A0A133NR88_GARVA|nr:hypothetical protein HMPREF3208_01347 [Gardnerella vaginalis]
MREKSLRFAELAQVGSPVDFQREFRKRALIARACSHVWSTHPCTQYKIKNAENTLTKEHILSVYKP